MRVDNMLIKERNYAKTSCVVKMIYIIVALLIMSNGLYIHTEQVNAETMVYVTKSGSKYHKKKCGRGNFYQDTLSAAKSRGLDPCKKCFPGGAPKQTSNSNKSSDSSKSKKTAKLNKSSLVLIVGQSKKLNLKNASGNVKWSSSDNGVASVNSKGKVKAKKKGKTVITAASGSISKKCKVKVENPKLNNNSIEIRVGSTYYLKLKGCSHDVDWYSEDEDIAYVDEDGSVYGNDVGTTTVNASVHGKDYVCTVTVVGEEELE